MQESAPEIQQLKDWSCKYSVYNGQYDVYLPAESEYADVDNKVTKLWSQTLPKLLLAPTEEEFDAIFAEFVEERDALGFEELMAEKTIYMNAAKEKLGID